MTKNTFIPEILAPCGSYSTIEAAIHAGADACYVGGNKFGARAYATNLDEISLIKAIEYAHLHDSRLYLTVNTLFKNSEIKELYNYIKNLYNHGLDALIVQDLGVFKFIKENFPDIAIHCSTQMNITSKVGAEFVKANGAARVVVAREMSLEQIREIKENVDIEVEAFVHGAMCYSYSGQCMLSSLAGGRSGNRGRCAQPCRKLYDDTYVLSMKDMCSLTNIPALVDAKIDSLKIEGRMKNEYYVASAVDAYKTLVNDYISGDFSEKRANELKFKLANIYNRGGFCEGYFFMHNGASMISTNRPNNQGVKLGAIKDIKDGKIWLELCNDLYKQDVLEVKLKDNTTIDITSGIDGRTGQRVWLNAPKTKQIVSNQEIYRTKCNIILEKVFDESINKPRLHSIDGYFNANVGYPMSLVLTSEYFGNTYSVTAYGDEVEMSNNTKADEDNITKKLSQLGNTDYEFSSLCLNVDENAFVPIGAIKKLRRDAISLLEEEVKKAFQRTAPPEANCKYDEAFAVNTDFSSLRSIISNSKLAVSVLNEDQLKIVLHYDFVGRIYISYMVFAMLSKAMLDSLREKAVEIVITTPDIYDASFDMEKIITNQYISGFYVKNIDGFSSLLKYDLDDKLIICGASLYAYNNLSLEFIANHVRNVIFDYPVELNMSELEELNKKYDYELVLYGYQRVMLSANCVNKTKNKCDNSYSVTNITDDKGNSFKCKAFCDGCYNVIYNKLPYCCLEKIEDFYNKKILPKAFRVDFTIENGNMVKSVMDVIKSSMYDNKKVSLNMETTYGHLYRGVE